MTASVVGSICLRVAGVRLLGCTHAASILLTFGLLASDCRVLYQRESCRKTLVIVLGQIFVVVPLCHSSDCGCSEVHILLSLQGFPPEFTLVVKMFWVKSPIVIEILTKLHTVHDSTHTRTHMATSIGQQPAANFCLQTESHLWPCTGPLQFQACLSAVHSRCAITEKSQFPSLTLRAWPGGAHPHRGDWHHQPVTSVHSHAEAQRVRNRPPTEGATVCRTSRSPRLFLLRPILDNA